MSKTTQPVAQPGLKGAFMSTYQPQTWFGRNAYMASIVPTADGGFDVDPKHLTSLMNSANTAMQKSEKDAGDVLAKMSVAYINAKVAIEASNNRLMSALQETEGKDRRQIVDSVQNEMSNIRDNMTVLNKVNRQTIDMPLQSSKLAFDRARGAGMDEGAAGQIAWEVAVNTISELGMASEGNPELPTLMNTMEKLYGPVEELADNTIKHNAMALKEVAGQAEDQRVLMRRRLDGDMGELESIVKDLENSSDIAGDLAKARAAAMTLQQEHGELADMLDPEGIGAQRDIMLQSSDSYQQSKDTYDQAKQMLLSSGGDEGTRLKMAQLLTSPQFRQWAESNGFKSIGNAEFNEDGTVKWIRPGPRDAFAIHVYASQLQTTPEQPIRFRNTREWARVEINGHAIDAKVKGSAYQELLGDNAYATMTDPETGETAYVSADTIDEVLAKNMPARPPGSLVFYTAPGNTPYLIEPDTGAVFSAHVKDEQRVWVKVNINPKDIGLDDFKNPPGKLALQNNGSGAMATAADVNDKPIDTVALSDDKDVKNQQAAMARSALTAAGISLTSEPPNTPTYYRYGKVMPMHASDPPGSIRLRGPGGNEDELIPPEKVGSVTITQTKSRTGIFDASSKVRGMHDAEIAKRGVGLAPGEKENPNLLDRAVAAVTPVEAGQFPEMAVRPGMEGIRRTPLETNPMSEVVVGPDAPGYEDTYANPKDAVYISKRKQLEIDKAANSSPQLSNEFMKKAHPESEGMDLKLEGKKPALDMPSLKAPTDGKEAAKPAEPSPASSSPVEAAGKEAEVVNPRLAPPEDTTKKTAPPADAPAEPPKASAAKMKALSISSMDLARAGIDPAGYEQPGKVTVPSYDAMLVRRGQVDRAKRTSDALLKPIDEANAKDSPVSQAKAANVTTAKPSPDVKPAKPASDDAKRAAMRAEVEKMVKAQGWDNAREIK